MENNKDFEVDLVDLFHYLKKKIAIVAVAALLFCIGGFVGTKLFGKPQYETQMSIYTSVLSTQNSANYADMQTATYITRDCADLIETEAVAEKVIEELKLDMSAKQLLTTIDVQNDLNTRVLLLKVKGTDPKQIADIANSVAKHAAILIQKVMTVDALKVVAPAPVPAEPTGPSAVKNGVMAGILVAILMVAGFCAIRITDSTIRDEEDVERYLGISVLGMIPEAQQGSKKKKSVWKRFSRMFQAKKTAKAK